MTKCPICGFAVPEDRSGSCPQCGEPDPAGKAGSESVEWKKTIRDSSALHPVMTKHTVMGRMPGDRNPSPDSAAVTCGGCGYPMRESSKFCPECGTPASAVETDANPEPVVAPQSAARLATRRLEDFQPATLQTSIRLTPVNHPDREVLESSQDEWTLGRGDIDPTDDSISEQPHLKIVRDADTGQWTLHNAASNQALFMQVGGEVVLRNDMVILIGQHHMYRVSLEGGK